MDEICWPYRHNRKIHSVKLPVENVLSREHANNLHWFYSKSTMMSIVKGFPILLVFFGCFSLFAHFLLCFSLISAIYSHHSYNSKHAVPHIILCGLFWFDIDFCPCALSTYKYYHWRDPLLFAYIRQFALTLCARSLLLPKNLWWSRRSL